jgi:hypothetical protein
VVETALVVDVATKFSCNCTTECIFKVCDTQASWRKIQQLGLVPLYNNDDDFRLFCGMMEGLAF